MSISTVGSASDSYRAAQKNGPGQQAQNLNDIANALQVGNLAGARKALGSFLQASQGSSDGGGGQGVSGGQSSKNVQALATALNSGDYAASAQAFRSLRQEVQNARKGAQALPQDDGQKPGENGNSSEAPAPSEEAADTALSAFRLDAQA